MVFLNREIAGYNSCFASKGCEQRGEYNGLWDWGKRICSKF